MNRREMINQNIKRELKRQGRGYAWLESKIGVGRGCVNNILNSKSNTVNLNFLEKTAEALDVDVTELLGYKEEEERKSGRQTYKDLVDIVTEDLSPYGRVRDAMIVDAVQGIDEHLANITNAIERHNILIDLLLKR